MSSELNTKSSKVSDQLKRILRAGDTLSNGTSSLIITESGGFLRVDLDLSDRADPIVTSDEFSLPRALNSLEIELAKRCGDALNIFSPRAKKSAKGE